MSNKSGFSSKIGLVLAAAGSAIGLGNIWKFPYVAGENGGGAFLIVYILCAVLFGLPLLVTEFYIGKRSGKSPFGAFRALSGTGRWQWLSWLCLVTSIIFLGFYFVPTGWCFEYLTESIFHTFQGMESSALQAHFGEVTNNIPRMLFFGLLPLFLSAFVVWFDVNEGIERISKILMPLLLVLMVVMLVHVLLLDGSDVGLRFFFHTDFSAITPRVFLKALGQCFFSLSVGIGTVITIGSYMPQTQKIGTTSVQVLVLDTLVAVMAGLIIFPAVFAFGCNPAEGPERVFVVLPAVLEQMSFSWLSSVLFFGLLCIAALTSTISILELCIAFLIEATAKTSHPLNRHQSVLINTAMITVLVVVCVLSGKVFTLFDAAITNLLMPLGAFAMSVFVGWSMPISRKTPAMSAYIFMMRFIVPAGIFIILLNGLGVF